MVQRNVCWKTIDGVGLEQLAVLETSDGFIADSLIIAVDEDQPIRLWYRIQLDHGWRVRSVRVYSTTDGEVFTDLPLDLHGPSFVLSSDGSGNWFNRHGQPERSLAGCIEIDISMTPFTNTLPIRRLNLQAGESADIPVVYINAPEMEISRVEQRYSCLEQTEAGATYLFEGLDSGFTAELPVDEDGLVLDYPETFERVWP